MLWLTVVPHISKGARYTLGVRIEEKFLDLIELSYTAYFTPKEHLADKIAKVAGCIREVDILKYLTSVAWEGKIISNTHFEGVGLKLGEAGKMFYNWQQNLKNPDKKNPAFNGEKK